MNFFRNLGLAAGNAILVGSELDARQAETEVNLQVAAGKKMARMAEERDAATAKSIGEFIKTEQDADASTVQNPLKASDLYAKGANMAVLSGSFEQAAKLSKLANGEAERVKTATEAVESKIHFAKEGLASAAMDYIGRPTAEGAAAVARAAVAAGINPMSLPPPGSAEFTSWTRAQQSTARTSHQRLSATENVVKFDTQERRRNTEFELRQQAALDARRDAAALREQLQRDKADAVSEARKATLVTKLNVAVQREAAPYLKDMEVANTLRGFLAANSPTADQQVQQILPSLLGSLKGRATNPYYKDNKFYGDLVQKVESAASRIFTGRYGEKDRQQMSAMIDEVERTVTIPSLNRLERQQKRQGKKLGLDPDAIEILGGFPREAGGSAVTTPPTVGEKDPLFWEAGKKPQAQGATGSWREGEATAVAAAPAEVTPSAVLGKKDEAVVRLQGDITALNAELSRSRSPGQTEILQQELRRATQQLEELKPAPAPAPAASRVLNGVTYVKKDGKWYSQ